MIQNLIKKWLLEKQSRVYSLIVESYNKELMLLKPTLFRKWLSIELAVPEEKINLSSLNSALMRQRKKLDKANKKILESVTINPLSTKTENEGEFKFSSPYLENHKSRTKEL